MTPAGERERERERERETHREKEEKIKVIKERDVGRGENKRITCVLDNLFILVLMYANACKLWLMQITMFITQRPTSGGVSRHYEKNGVTSSPLMVLGSVILINTMKFLF